MYTHFLLVLHSVIVHMLMSHAEMCECSSCVRRVNNQDMNTGSDYSNSFAFVKTFICPGCTFIVYCCRVSKKIGIFWFWIIVMCLCILLAYSVCGLNKKGFCETNQLWIIVCTQVYGGIRSTYMYRLILYRGWTSLQEGFNTFFFSPF